MNTPIEYKEHLNRQGFDLKNKIGSGLSGGLYLAVQRTLNRQVVVKFFDNSISLKNPSLRKRFHREPIILAKLQHPNIPYVLTSGVINKNDSDIPYTVMQYISGKTFEDVIRQRASVPKDVLLDYIKQVLTALDMAHEKSIIHRDIKPANLMVLDGGHCYLIDFSIGVSLIEESGLTRTTRAGNHLGTFNYMSPEQKSDMTNIDGRSDIYSIGIVLLEMLTGSIDISDLQNKLVKEPIWLRETVMKACAYDPIDRFQKASDFFRAITISSNPIKNTSNMTGVAFCANFKCPDADWSHNGYFRNPRIIEKSHNSFCTSCGGQLNYQCNNCGSQFSNERYCGNCCSQHFEIPKCRKCGSLLEEEYLHTDTRETGCGKCIRAAEQKKLHEKVEFDDDIPF